MIRCGTDIIEIDRVRKSIDNIGEKFINTIFTENEKRYCESHNKMKYQHYAARFAAKEAIYKAFSGKKELSWKDVEIINNESGRPKVVFLRDMGEDEISVDISISHCKDYATASVVVYFA
ncbi:MAG: holo-ACP synthase [Clostridia bacterium]|nr:holo-ACP synthase [Clostridia bacterium]MBR3152210.1 holo-ACP synthase [Clostridia bacterium]MBR3152253.1 holo-ACP synthase [Clostridia bacterium]